MGWYWDKPNIDPEPGKATWLAKGNPEEMSHKWIQTTMKVRLCLQVCPCVYKHVLFPTNKHLFHYFIFVGIHFCKADETRDLPLSTGLVASIQ